VCVCVCLYGITNKYVSLEEKVGAITLYN
jgi:hypothetical protein